MAVFGAFTQSVAVGGFTIFVHDMQITEDAGNRSPSIQFSVDEGVNPGPAFSAIVPGAPVAIVQTVGGQSYSRVGRVLTVAVGRYRTGSFLRVSATGESYDLQRIRFQKRWTEIPATKLIEDAFSEFGPGYGLSLQQNSTIIEEYESSFDTLYKLMQSVCELTGWAWSVESGVVRFFNPLLESSDPITQPLDLLADTLTVNQSLEGIYNVALAQAYTYRKFRVTRTLEPGACLREIYIEPQWQNWSLVGTPFIEGSNEITASYTEEGVLRLSRDIAVDEPTDININLTFRRLVWVESIDEDSVNQYGPLYAPPVATDGSQGVQAVKQRLSQFLLEHSQPSVEVEASISHASMLPDTVARVTLTDPALTRDLYVERVTRTSSRTELEVSVRLVSPDSGATRLTERRPDPAVAMEKRITRLERRDARELSVSGNFATLVGPIRSAPTPSDAWGWNFAFDVNISTAVSDSAAWSEDQQVVNKPVLADYASWVEQIGVVLTTADISVSREVTTDNFLPIGFTVEREVTGGPAPSFSVEREVSGRDSIYGITVQGDIPMGEVSTFGVSGEVSAGTLPGITIDNSVPLGEVSSFGVDREITAEV